MPRRGCLIVSILLIAAVLLVPFQGIVWDGRFDSAEYRLRFIDESGRPVPDIRLKVLTKAGEPCHFYPINEFTPDGTAVSDADGRMMFHHAGDLLEFGGREYWNLVGMRFGETDAPQYDFVFSLGEREVHRVKHDAIRPRGNSEVARRTWSQRRPVHDRHVDEKDDRETRTAISHVSRYSESDHEVDFKIVERTITIAAP